MGSSGRAREREDSEEWQDGSFPEESARESSSATVRVFIFHRSRWGRVPRKSTNFVLCLSLSLSLLLLLSRLQNCEQCNFFVNYFSLSGFPAGFVRLQSFHYASVECLCDLARISVFFPEVQSQQLERFITFRHVAVW